MMKRIGWLLLAIMAVTVRPIMAEEMFDENEDATVSLNFQLVQQHGASCLSVESVGLELASCVYEDPFEDGRCYPRNRAVMRSCEENKESQLWRYNPQTLQLHHQEYSSGMCLTRMVQTVEMLPCFEPANPAQQWRFGNDGDLNNQADSKQSGSFLFLLDGSGELFFSLQYRFTPPSVDEARCYFHPVTGEKFCREKEVPSEPEEGSAEEDDSEEGVESDAPGEEPPLEQPEPDDNTQDENQSEDIPDENVVPPKPRHWLSGKQTPPFTMPLEKTGRCLSLKLPEGCSPVEGDEQSKNCLEANRVDLQPCTGGLEQQWRHDLQRKRIFNLLSGDEFCLTWAGNVMKMFGCFIGNSSQQNWYFTHGRTKASPEKGRLRTQLRGARNPYLYLKGLTLPVGIEERRAIIKFRMDGDNYPSCTYHPESGKQLTDC